MKSASGAPSKKPRVAQGSQRLTTRVSELAGHVLLVQQGALRLLDGVKIDQVLVVSGIRTK